MGQGTDQVEVFSDAKTMTPGTYNYSAIDEKPMPVVAGPGGMSILARAEIDIQIATAHQYPRSITQFRREALAMATMDVDTAESCFYKLPRGGKIIDGPGVRLAEIVGSAYGNMRYGARIVGEEGDFIVAQGIAHDLEKNVAATIEVRRRIVNKQGRRFDTDMIGVTANAACSIALRNAIFKVIPRSFVNSIYESAKQVAIGDASTLVERRTRALETLAKMGAMEDRVLAMLGKAGIEDIDLTDLELLTGLRTAIKDGDTTVDQAFPPLKAEKKHTGSDKAIQPKKTDKDKKAEPDDGMPFGK